MPELPEVEIVRRRLAPLVEGRTIESVRAAPRSYFFLSPPATLRRSLPGRTIAAVERHGKYLVIRFTSGDGLLVHLGMTGQLLVVRNEETSSRDTHVHLQFRFRDCELGLRFRDVRKFGKVRWLPAGTSDPRLDRLGPDALGIEAEPLRRAGTKRKVPIKTLLLDQSVVAGVGNIYADEALFLAGVRPTKSARRVPASAYPTLARCVREVLQRAIDAGGSTISDYRQPDGSRGTYQEQRAVYSRTGEPCRVCGAIIRRKVVGQRSSHYCPTCQR